MPMTMGEVSICQKVKVMLWKSFVIRKCHWFLTLCEIVIPVTLFALIAFGRSRLPEMGKQYVTTPTYNSEHSSQEHFNDRYNPETRILYFPKTTFINSLIYKVQLKLTINNEVVKGFDSELDLMAYHDTFLTNRTVIAVIFNNVQDKETPQHLDYVVRPFDNYVDWESASLFSYHQYIPDFGSANYIHKGFIALQMAIDIAFIEMTTKKEFSLMLTMQEFPYPPHLVDSGITNFFIYVLPFVTILSFVFLCPALLKRVVEEKSTGIKELMKMMGLKSWMLWLGWFLHAFLINCVSIFIIAILMKAKLWQVKFPPIEYCSASVFVVFLILYCAASITFCFAISAAFNRPTFAMVFGIIAWIVSHSIPNILMEDSFSMRWGKKIIFGLFPNTALTFGFQVMGVYESREIGCNWGNLFESASNGKEEITMGNVLIMFIIDIFVYMLITFYVEQVKPGPYGLAKPLHFPFLYIYGKIINTDHRIGNEEFIAQQYCKIEEESSLKPGIEISNLYKNYGKRAAINGLSINIYEGQITALLGHNGAGKTTTMSIITGMISASSGKVLVKGKDITQNMNKLCGTIGLCPQHNLQFTDLTVMQHLIFFAMLKGLSRVKAIEEAENCLRRMHLYEKRDNLASTLSGGMRRKLSLGIAIIGDSQVLILDEPTSGLDPEARRDIWDILLTLRGSCTILITTHFMEEADVLGDRIAIMDHGRLMCYGTSMFLKNEYGTGYHLTLIYDEKKLKSVNPRSNELDAITDLIKGKIRNADLKAHSGNHVTYLLPHEMKSNFGELLAELEKKKESLGISNLSLSVTTLEEVFLRVGNMSAIEDTIEKTTFTLKSPDIQHSHAKRVPKSTGINLLQLQLKTLFLKRLRITWKKKWIFLFHVLIAVCVTLLTLYLSQTKKQPTRNIKFDMDLSKYGDTVVFYGGSESEGDLAKMQRQYANIVAAQRGEPQNVSDVSSTIIAKGIENIVFYNQHMIVAAEFNKSAGGDVVNAMYSNAAIHGAPISLNLLMNAVLRGFMGDEYSISTANSPVGIGRTTEEVSESSVSMVWFMWFPLGMLFLSTFFLVFPQVERVSRIKQLQLMCGVRSIFYWFTCYVCDFIVYLGAITIIIICVAIHGLLYSGMFSGCNEIGAIFVILIAYGLCILPYAYIFSYKRTLGGAVASFLILSMFISIIFTSVVLICYISGDEYYKKVSKTIKYFFLLYPQFGLTYISVKFSRKVVWNYNWAIKSDEQKFTKCRFHYNPCCDGYDSTECIAYRSYFGGDKGIGIDVFEMGVSCVIYFLILLFLETVLVRRLWDTVLVFIYNKINRKLDETDSGKSHKDDVLNEMERVSKTLKKENLNRELLVGQGDELTVVDNREDDNDLLLVHNLEKMFWGQKAVNGVSFGVKPGDCFGLLGVNGAGKTTLFRMLTGDEIFKTGEARILVSHKNLIRIGDNKTKFLENVGYCPQFDALNEILTGREMLKLFAELRGISESVDEEVNKWLSALGLDEYADIRCGKYSGGNKRKLSIGMALIGNPLLVMLDEPTSGVDPVSRRKLWNILTEIQQQENKPSILLTSHSMEECEALCNKLAIMKTGKLECYGSIPELKQQYGQGFTVMVKLKLPALIITVGEDNQSSILSDEPAVRVVSNSPHLEGRPVLSSNDCEMNEFMREFESKYKGFCTLRDRHSGLLRYHISNRNLRWSTLFNEIEELQQKHAVVEDYCISETTLEEVFLSIARSEN